ncbi:hypothetical protein BJV82DRAFT_661886 [Fennellomyces sp. T-0311]|nr:hypothetical protein BJV82DRAFT_661886 [Fennellomyces sp. T-0311]
MESHFENQNSEFTPTDAAEDSQPKVLRRKLCKWNALVYLVFKGTEEEKSTWCSKIGMLETGRAPTMAEVAVAYRDLTDVDLAALQRKAEDIEKAKAQSVDGVTHDSRARKIIRALQAETLKLSIQFGWDVAVFMSSPQVTDWGRTSCITNSDAGDAAVAALGGRGTFNKLCSGKRDSSETNGCRDSRLFGLEEYYTGQDEKAKRKRTQKLRTMNDWSGFKQMVVDGEVRYRHEVACLNMVVCDDANNPVDFGSVVAPNLSAMSNDLHRYIATAVNNKTLFVRFDDDPPSEG